MVRLTIALFSRAFIIPRSAFYRVAQPPTRKGDTRLVAVIKDILLKHPRYGYRQVTNRLRRERIAINAKRTLRLMRCHDLQNKPLRRPRWRGGRAAGELPNLSAGYADSSGPAVADGHHLRAIAITLDLPGRSDRCI
jgi:hypothetical protein